MRATRELSQGRRQDLANASRRDLFGLGKLLERRPMPAFEPEALDEEAPLATRELVEQTRHLLLTFSSEQVPDRQSGALRIRSPRTCTGHLRGAFEDPSATRGREHLATAFGGRMQFPVRHRPPAQKRYASIHCSLRPGQKAAQDRRFQRPGETPSRRSPRSDCRLAVRDACDSDSGGHLKSGQSWTGPTGQLGGTGRHLPPVASSGARARRSGAPATGTTFEDVAVMEKAIEHGGDCGVRRRAACPSRPPGDLR